MGAVTKINIMMWLALFTILCIEITYLQGWTVGLKSIIMWAMLGYFLGDIYIATVHFEIDNFKPEDNGYKHHLVIAKYGFKYEKLIGRNPYLVEENVIPTGQTNSDLPSDSGCCYPQCCYPRSNNDDCPNQQEIHSKHLKDHDSKLDGESSCCYPRCCYPRSKNSDCSDQRKIHSKHLEDQQSKLDDESSCCYPKCCYPKSNSSDKENDHANNELHRTLLEKLRLPILLKDLSSLVFSAVYNLLDAVQKSVVSDKQISIFDKKSMLICSMPILFTSLGCSPGISLIYPMICILSEISGSGSPDYYAHHHEKAPKVVKYAQQLHLMMTPSSHEEHHKNPTMGYAYFSPITNLVLDNSGYWPLAKMMMEYSKNMKAVPVPVPLLDE